MFDLNAERAAELAARRQEAWAKASPNEKRQKVREAVGVRTLAKLPEAKSRVVGAVQRDGYRIDKLILSVEPDMKLPALLFRPSKPAGEACIYLHGQGKHVDAAPGGPIEELVHMGALVLAVDLRGIGETAAGPANALLGADWKEFYLAYLLGQSMVGLRTEDTLAAARFLANHDSGGKPRSVRLVGIGQSAVPALHAAALEPGLFAKVKLNGGLSSWSDVMATSEPAGQLTSAVHGVLGCYDLPDLLPLCRPAEVAAGDGAESGKSAPAH